jgi:hypothetical protein
MKPQLHDKWWWQWLRQYSTVQQHIRHTTALHSPTLSTTLKDQNAGCFHTQHPLTNDGCGPQRYGPPCCCSALLSWLHCCSKRCTWEALGLLPTPQEWAVEPATTFRPAAAVIGEGGKPYVSGSCRTAVMHASEAGVCQVAGSR